MSDLVLGHARMTQVPAYILLHISKPSNKTERTKSFVTERMTGDLICHTIINSNYENAVQSSGLHISVHRKRDITRHAKVPKVSCSPNILNMWDGDI
jgi:hypothetical protein